MKRSFLFLQGPGSNFFRSLAAELKGKGHRVLKVSFDDADKQSWGNEDIAEYKNTVGEFGEYIKNMGRLRKITDLVLYSDLNPIHESAIEALRNQKIRIHVFGRGYFSESAITHEDRTFGSALVYPRDPRFYLRREELAEKLNFPSIRESIFTQVKRNFVEAKLKKVNYFLADLKLGKKASFIRSFAKAAPSGSYLALHTSEKIDDDQRKKVMALAEKYEISTRIMIFEAPSFRSLVKHCKAYVTQGSMKGLYAITKNKPVITIEDVFYNIAGLTNQCDLNDFWQSPVKPDMEIFRKFRDYVSAKTQVTGSFTSPKGIKLAVKAVAARMLGAEAQSQTNEANDAS